MQQIEKIHRDLSRIFSACRYQPYPETLADCAALLEGAIEAESTAYDTAKLICLEAGLALDEHRQEMADALINASYFPAQK